MRTWSGVCRTFANLHGFTLRWRSISILILFLTSLCARFLTHLFTAIFVLLLRDYLDSRSLLLLLCKPLVDLFALIIRTGVRRCTLISIITNYGCLCHIFSFVLIIIRLDLGESIYCRKRNETRLLLIGPIYFQTFN